MKGGGMKRIGEMLPQRHRTLMTRIGRIFTDIFNPCASVSSVRSVFYHKYNEPQISRNFGLRSVGVCCAYPSFDKPFLKVYADERRYVAVTELGATTHRKGRKERKAMQQEPLRSGVTKIRYSKNNELERTDTNSGHSEFVRVRISSMLISVLRLLFAPAHERMPSQPAPVVHPRLSRAGE